MSKLRAAVIGSLVIMAVALLMAMTESQHLRVRHLLRRRQLLTIPVDEPLLRMPSSHLDRG